MGLERNQMLMSWEVWLGFEHCTKVPSQYNNQWWAFPVICIIIQAEADKGVIYPARQHPRD